MTNKGVIFWYAHSDIPLQQKAIKEVKARLLAAFILGEKEAEEIATDAVKEAAKNPFVVSSTLKIEQLIYQAFYIINQWNQPQEENEGSAETDMEDALHYIESFKFEGSPKQVAWAESIALKSVSVRAVAEALKAGKKIPSSAKWWIENRNNISFLG